MEQGYIQAHRLLSEVKEIDNIPDSFVKAVRWRQWKVKAQHWVSQPQCLPHHLKLVQSSVRHSEQNHDVVNQLTSKN
ncbi:MAG: hypothetical protein ACI935_002132 [Moritella dasanensis]|jgi:hypothetical protein